MKKHATCKRMTGIRNREALAAKGANRVRVNSMLSSLGIDPHHKPKPGEFIRVPRKTTFVDRFVSTFIPSGDHS